MSEAFPGAGDGALEEVALETDGPCMSFADMVGHGVPPRLYAASRDLDKFGILLDISLYHPCSFGAARANRTYRDESSVRPPLQEGVVDGWPRSRCAPVGSLVENRAVSSPGLCEPWGGANMPCSSREGTGDGFKPSPRGFRCLGGGAGIAGDVSRRADGDVAELGETRESCCCLPGMSCRGGRGSGQGRAAVRPSSNLGARESLAGTERHG